ncbi:MAG: hypothetical protein U0903_07495 [Planctomycetales bacterium]
MISETPLPAISTFQSTLPKVDFRPSVRHYTFFRLIALLLLLSVIPGCRKSEGPPTYPAEGELRIGGKPAFKAQVTFHPVDGQDFDKRGARPNGIVDANGKFKLTTYKPGDGAPEGKYCITIYWAENPDSIEPSPDRLREKYLYRGNSQIFMEIKPQKNQLPPINLEG